MAFLDGPPPTRLCQPMVDYITARGGEVILNAPVREFVLHREVREMAIDGFRLGNVSRGAVEWLAGSTTTTITTTTTTTTTTTADGGNLSTTTDTISTVAAMTTTSFTTTTTTNPMTFVS